MSGGSALVVGAGIMGLSTARALVRRGLAVTVLDAGAIPNPAGGSVDQHRLIRHAYGAEAGYTRMVTEAYGAWERLWADLGRRHHWPTGTLALAAPGSEGWLETTRAILAAAGLARRALSPAAAAARLPGLRPDGLAAALWLPSGGVLFAERIQADLARWLAAAGARLRPHCRALAIDAEAGAVTTTTGERLVADLVFLAAGAWTGGLLPARAGRIRPSRQVVVYLEPPAAERAAWRAAPMLLEIDPAAGFYLVPPVGGTALKIGDHRFSLTGDPDGDRSATPAEIESVLELARQRLATIGDWRIVAARVCFYDWAAEERFVVEPLGARAWLAAGFSGHGFKFGPLIGERLAAAALEGRPIVAWAAGATGP